MQAAFALEPPTPRTRYRKPPKVGLRGCASTVALTASDEARFQRWRAATDARTYEIGGRWNVYGDGLENVTVDACTRGEALRAYWRDWCRQ